MTNEELFIIKDKVQKDALNLWYLRGERGTLALATGVGKSRCGVLATKYVVSKNKDAKILIISPTETIRDNSWKSEFKKWEAVQEYENNVITVCINTAYKWGNKHFDLVIADGLRSR